ncbi:uncharacterized protein LOC129868502 isoform X3 [Salvelinus fontinalis]|nr:uncharacterized protein LOC129868502 isoform X3 [Salvelinus fontinalis]
MVFFGVLRSEATADSTEVPSPRILQPHRSKIRAVPGKQLIIECKADPGLPDDFTHVYWLVNSTFPEVAFTDGRVSETEESASEDGRVIQRSLVLKNVTAEDFKSTFTCVISSLAGLDRRTVTLMPTRLVFPHYLTSSPFVLHSLPTQNTRGNRERNLRRNLAKRIRGKKKKPR